MNPEEFTLDMWGPQCGYGGFAEFDHENNVPRKGFRELGRCDAMQLRCRPRIGQAVMLWDEAERVQFWIHVVGFNQC